MIVARPFLAAAAVAFVACSRPEVPTVQPISGRVSAISNTGITVDAKLEAYNPNDFEISVKSFTATIVLDHQYNIGTVTSAQAVTLPAKKKKLFEVPITIKWNDVGALAPLAMSSKDVPYEASGSVKVDTGSIDLDVPFKVTGVVTHAQISQAVGKAIPRIPGLPF